MQGLPTEVGFNALNAQFLQGAEAALISNPGANLSAMLRSYMAFGRELKGADEPSWTVAAAHSHGQDFADVQEVSPAPISLSAAHITVIETASEKEAKMKAAHVAVLKVLEDVCPPRDPQSPNSLQQKAAFRENVALVGLENELTHTFTFEGRTLTSAASPLEWACWFDKGDFVNTLLSMGANINRESKVGATALIQAAFAGHLSVLKTLLHYGATLEARMYEKTALEWALERGHRECAVLLQLAADSWVD